MTEQSREYGEGLYALCAEEALSGDVLEQLDVLNGSFKAQPDYLRLLSNMSLAREERLDILEENMRSMGMNAEAYRWYADLRRYGTVPHAGFGAGFERLLMFVTGVTNIRDVLPFARTPRNCEF